MAQTRLVNRSRARMTPKTVTKRAVKDMIHSVQELKMFCSTVTSNVAFTTAGLLVPLTPIAQGDDIGNRSGDTISMRQLQYRMVGFNGIVAQSCTFRLIIFSDSMGSGAAIAVTDLLQSVSHLSAYNNINYQRRRFKIYHDELYPVVGGTNVQEQDVVVTSNIGQKRYFNDVTGTVTNIGKNALYALVIASANNGTHSFAWDVTYTDS